MSHTLGEALVRKWAGKLGLGEFRIQVVTLSPDNKKAWALSFYDIEEMWGIIDLPVDETHPAPLLELLVVHELSHGLIELAKSGKVAVEQACNRIARLALADYETPLPNEDTARRIGDPWYESGRVKHMAGSIDRRAWLAIVVDALPEQDRALVNMLYVEGLSLREAGARLGLNDTNGGSMLRRRDRALDKLREYFDKLENAEWHAARRIISLRMPEAGAEHEVIYELHHRCSVANALIRTEVGTEDMDLLVFPVGNVGYGMPRGVPFGVEALDPCASCGQNVGVYFVWQAGHSSHPGQIWTP